ncbi:hypothetical protein A5696_04805 [Mycobacterium sp. E2699]|nr:hypothetical protein A5696_04805 [Mycobacterium sp. E2699]
MAGGNSTSAIGSPDARLFFDPQNSRTIASPRSSRASRAMTLVMASTTASSAAATTVTETRRHPPTLPQIPLTTPIANAVYTTSRMDPRSTTFSSAAYRATAPPSHGRAS